MLKMVKKRERILVVDDDEPSREIMAETLAEAGYTVEEAADGYEALWIAARRSPDLIVSDLSMPGIDGIELARRLHVFAQAVPVVLTTGIEETRDVVTAAREYGAVACLKKPMTVDELLWTIDRALVCAGTAAPVPTTHGRPAQH
ncbi:MAG TPA: response regulator [Polyangia bacterium]|nr:response regulator [Polyangia bacterium]